MMMKSTRDSPILVTGAAGAVGAIGRNLTEMLLAKGHKVRALVRREDERAGAAFRLLAPSQMRELATAPDVRLRAIVRNRFSRLSFNGWIERGHRDREQVVQPKRIWVAYSEPLIRPNRGGRGRQQRR